MIKLKVEIANNPITLASGLMYRKALPRDHGMLFQFPKREASFWGLNTYIPLDIAFIDNGVITEIESITPMSTRPVKSKNMCSMAIEANAGFFKQNQIRPGHKIEIHNNEVYFNA